jgi:hypothetical protein
MKAIGTRKGRAEAQGPHAIVTKKFVGGTNRARSGQVLPSRHPECGNAIATGNGIARAVETVGAVSLPRPQITALIQRRLHGRYCWPRPCVLLMPIVWLAFRTMSDAVCKLYCDFDSALGLRCPHRRCGCEFSQPNRPSIRSVRCNAHNFRREILGRDHGEMVDRGRGRSFARDAGSGCLAPRGTPADEIFSLAQRFYPFALSVGACGTVGWQGYTVHTSRH